MLTGILKSNGRSIEYYDQLIYSRFKDYKSNLGVVPQEIALYEDLSTWDNISSL